MDNEHAPPVRITRERSVFHAWIHDARVAQLERSSDNAITFTWFLRDRTRLDEVRAALARASEEACGG